MNTLGPAKYVRYKQNVVKAGVIYVVIMDLVLKKLKKIAFYNRAFVKIIKFGCSHKQS